MPRPVDADSAATFDRIVRAALAELTETVPRNAISMRKVGERAGVSLGTLQYYFESKDRLLEACLDGYYRDLAQEAQRLLSALASGPVPAGEAAIRGAVASMYHFIVRQRALIELRLITTSMRGELAPERQHEFMGTVIRDAAELLDPHVEIDRDELRLTIQFVSASLIRLALLSPSERIALTGSDDEAAVAAFVERAVCRLVRPRPASA
ncbi:MAG: TetR/AcrR family transcriptional regulator [Myxococcales bacterium]|nr:TetR/AcrR family transcriptional regulator [Myxococcales bacterium]